MHLPVFFLVLAGRSLFPPRSSLASLDCTAAARLQAREPCNVGSWAGQLAKFGYWLAECGCRQR